MSTTFDVEAIAAGGGKLRSFQDGAVIYRRGDISDCAYIIKHGCVELRHKGRAIERLCAGEIFGEMGLIEGGARMATPLCVGPVELVAIDCAMFASLLRYDEEFALSVMRLMARRHRATVEMYERCLDALPAKVQPVVAIVADQSTRADASADSVGQS
jgi:CRP-like cAMP-binding protein